jgi:hypothetical protein
MVGSLNSLEQMPVHSPNAADEGLDLNSNEPEKIPPKTRGRRA